MNLGKEHVCNLFERYLVSRNMSPSTIARYLREVRHFFGLGAVTDIRDVSREIIYEYITILTEAENKEGKPRFKQPVVCGMIVTLRILFSYLYRSEYILSNPFDEAPVQLRRVRTLRTDISIAEMSQFLAAIKGDDRVGVRDRAIFEMLYATGLRVGELVALDVEDIDTSGRRLTVKKGKGSKERIVPLAHGVTEWLERYMRHARKGLVLRIREKKDTSALFVSMMGTRLSRAGVEARAKYYSNLIWQDEKRVTPHIFRHSFASHLLMNGASVKDVSVLLGHATLDSTVGYTHFTVRSLKRIMKQYHPLENELYTEGGRLEEIKSILTQ